MSKGVYKLILEIEANNREDLVNRPDIDKLIDDKRTILFSVECIEESKEENNSGT